MKQVHNDLAVRRVAELLKRYDDCNPEVGMAPFWSSHVDEALRLLGLEKTDVDYKALGGRTR